MQDDKLISIEINGDVDKYNEIYKEILEKILKINSEVQNCTQVFYQN